MLNQEYTEEKQVTLRRLSNGRRLLEALFIIVALFALWLMVALFSFNPSDPSWSQTAWHEPIHNLGGLPGAWLADTLFFIFGVMAYLIPILIIGTCCFAWRHRGHAGQYIDYFSVALRLIGMLALIVTSCGLAAMNADDIWYFASGGVIGSLLGTALAPLLTVSESTLALLFVWAAGFTLFTGWSWVTIAEKVGSVVMRILTFASNRARGESHWRNEPSLAVNNMPELGATAASTVAVDASSSSAGNSISATKQAATQTVSAQPITPLMTTQVQPSSPQTASQQSLSAEKKDPVRDVLIRQQNCSEKFSSATNEHSDNTLFSGQPMPLNTPAFSQITDNDVLFSGHTVTDELNDSVTTDNRETDVNTSITPLYITQPGQTLSITEQPVSTQSSLTQSLPEQQSVITQTAISNVPPYTEQQTEPEQKDWPQPHTNTCVPTGKTSQYAKPLTAPSADIHCTPPELSNYPEINENSDAGEQDSDNHHRAEHKIDHNMNNNIVQLSAEFTMANVPPPVVQPVQESLIHPLLMHNGNDRPLPKPTTPLPSLDLLTSPPPEVEPVDNFALEQMARLVEARLADFRIKADVVNYLPGPVITRFELNLAPGVKAARISNLARDLARSLSAVAVRVVEVIPGKPYVGLELPNKKRQTVYLREVLDCPQFRDNNSPLSVVLGKDISGDPVVADLAKMPHLLVAGTTGSGKSVGVNAMILSMLYKATPNDVRFIMIDPKMLELSVYEGIPHLLTEVVTDMKDAANALLWSVGEMERRYKLMSALGVRNLAGYNDKINQATAMQRPIPDPYWKPGDSMETSHPVLEKLPYIVVIVDEFADLMMSVGKKVEELIARLAQKARAAGIHLVLATQRPSVDVITGLIKANIPTRIAFTVSSKIDSRTILDQGGAESLLGMGDMLYAGAASSSPVRVHGAFVRDQEVHAVVQDWKARGRPQYITGITEENSGDLSGTGIDSEDALDPLFDQAVAFVVEKRKASISGVQRQLRIGYNRAARIIEQMEIQGIVSEAGHNGNREVLAPPSFE